MLKFNPMIQNKSICKFLESVLTSKFTKFKLTNFHITSLFKVPLTPKNFIGDMKSWHDF